MEKSGETTPKKELTLPNTGSRLIWFPFIITYFFILAIVAFSFIGPIKIADKTIDIALTNQTMQLIILGALLIISLVLPLWSYSIRKPSSKYNYPLGLPKGSVRGLLALMAAVACVVLIIRREAIDDARNIFVLVVALYFFSRSSETSMEYWNQETSHPPKSNEPGLAEQKTTLLR